MELSKGEVQMTARLWSEYHHILQIVFERLIQDYTDELSRRDTEWENLRQSIEYVAKRQAVIDVKPELSRKYE